MSDALFYTTHPTVIGNLLLVSSARGLRFVTLLVEGENAFDVMTQHVGTATYVAELDGFFATAKAAIDRYFTEGTPLKLPVDLAGGTALQRSVWVAISRIPYGETISYTTLAEKVGFPRAVRAVASACGANPVPLAIACHRVVAKDGTLGGFSLGGTQIKEFLLKSESNAQRVAA